MRSALLFLCLLISFLVKSQTLENRIQQVENGFIFPSIIQVDNPLPQHNILDQLKKYKIHGASVAVIQNGKLDWSKAYGYTDKSHTQPIHRETLFQSASIGKIITALVALRLVQEGKLNLDENVNKKLKRWKLNENNSTQNQPVTLKHLLSHSAGLTDDYGFLGYKPNSKTPTLIQILENASPAKAKKSLDIKTIPGTVERYSGAGYLIVQLLIEEVSGMSFDECVQQYVFDPLQMSNSTYEYYPDEHLKKEIATGHHANGKPLRKKKYHIYPEKAAAGPWTTAEDLAKLVIGIQKHQILNKELTKELLTPQINRKGLGVNLRGIDEPLMFWHAGQNLGYMGLLYGSIEEGNGAVILINSDGGERFVQEFMSSVATAYQWPLMKSYQRLKISQKEKESILGTYQNPTVSLSIKEKKGRLVVAALNSKETAELYKIAENHYTFKDAQDYYRLVFKHTDERVTELAYTESIGKTLTLKKL